MDTLTQFYMRRQGINLKIHAWVIYTNMSRTLSAASGLAPASSKWSTTSVCPRPDAHIRAVIPCWREKKSKTCVTLGLHVIECSLSWPIRSSLARAIFGTEYSAHCRKERQRNFKNIRDLVDVSQSKSRCCFSQNKCFLGSTTVNIKCLQTR